MPVTANDFLNALNLPSQHPYYVQPQHGHAESEPKKKEFSISNYFRSVAWEDLQSAKSQNSINDECVDFPSPPWGKRRNDRGVLNHDHVCHHDLSSSIAAEKLPLDSTNFNESAVVGNTIAIDFLQDIRPCLVSLFRVHILLWAPLVLFFCLKRLSAPTRKCRDSDLVSTDVECSIKSTNDREISSGSSQKSAFHALFFILPIWKRMTSFSDYLPSPITSTMNQTTYRPNGQSSQPNQNSSSFERIIFFSSIIASVVSTMASVFAIFSIEEGKEKASSPVQNENSTGPSPQRSVENEQCFKKGKEADISGGRESDGKSPKSLNRVSSLNLTGDWIAYVIALIFSATIMTDAMYVYEFSQNYLLAFHLLIVYISMKRFGAKTSLCTALPITAIALFVMSRQDLNLPTTIEPGLYYDESNPFISEVIRQWPVEKRTYDDGRGTPWMMTGDTRTGIPFLVNNIPTQKYIRRWVPLPDEHEAVILDIAFPDSMTIDDDKRVYLVLHGINGDSNEGYVVDFVSRQVSKGNIVAVMVTRGLGDSPIVGQNVLHFARTSDVAAAAKALKSAIKRTSSKDGSAEKPLLLAGVGYSMGAITLANYVAKSGPKCDLDAAVGFSGALDTRQQVNFPRSRSLWQTFIAKMMKDTLLRKFSRQIRNKFNNDQMRAMMEARDLIELDQHFFAAYNGFDSLDDYYESMGAMGDFVGFGNKQDEGRISNVSIPLCMVQGLDDPVAYWGTFHDPAKVAKTGSGMTNILFTRSGGHVGWSLGWNPSINGWGWMSDVASSYVEAVGRAHIKEYNITS